MDASACPDRTLLPCFPGDRTCFTISDLCLYKIDHFGGPGYLKTCRNGWHLANCSNHVCHQHFKCQSYYCIPHIYVCNGRQDCPLGNDEKACTNRFCGGLFKCLYTGLCIHQNDICNGVIDCQEGDDEIFCEVSDCLNNCKCLMTTMSCSNTTIEVRWCCTGSQEISSHPLLG